MFVIHYISNEDLGEEGDLNEYIKRRTLNQSTEEY